MLPHFLLNHASFSYENTKLYVILSSSFDLLSSFARFREMVETNLVAKDIIENILGDVAEAPETTKPSNQKEPTRKLGMMMSRRVDTLLDAS